MATQRLTVATVTGESARAINARFESWRSATQTKEVDQFCAAVRANGASLPFVYFCEWIDPWLMGDLVPGPRAVAGQRFQMTCLTPEQALEYATQCPIQFPEQQWLTARLRDAAGTWDALGQRVVIVIREVVGGTTTDEEVLASLGVIPDWLGRTASSLG